MKQYREQIDRIDDEIVRLFSERMAVAGEIAEYKKENGTRILRVYIDKEGGVGINDCEAVSRRLDPLLDNEDFIEEAYVLEVSSPGLGRVLKRPRDFEYAHGRMVEIRTYKPVDKKKEWSGVLKAWDKDTVTIELESEEKTFERNSISLIRLAFDPE